MCKLPTVSTPIRFSHRRRATSSLFERSYPAARIESFPEPRGARASILVPRLGCESDSGTGFDTDEAKTSRGLGLISMEERLKLLNGSLSIDAVVKCPVLQRGYVRPIFRSRVSFKGVVSPSPVRSRVGIIGCLLALLCICVLARPGHAASDRSRVSSASSAVLPSGQTNPPNIVVGFLGGFVRHDEPHHPEVQLIQDLRQEYPKEVYFGLFENRKVGVAYNTILKLLGTKEGDALSDDQKRRARIVLFGHSWGASAVVSLSRKLQRAGIPVMLTIQIDSVAKPFQNDSLIPANVIEAVNFYQTHGLIQGRRKIVPADPAHTTILGNFLWEYKGEPAECYGFSWRGRLLSKGHTQIECDHKVWLQVRTLLGRHLPNPVVTETDAVEPVLLPSGDDRDGSQQR